MNLFAIEDIMPDKTIFFDIDYQLGLNRIKKNNREADRLDNASNHFHQKVYEGYLEVCDKYADRIVKIDASLDIDSVVEQVMKEVYKIIC